MLCLKFNSAWHQCVVRITGATGSGKTYMACAFGMEACKHYYSVRYVRLPDLLLDLQAARDNGTFSNVLKKYTKPIVLILDEWLLLKLTEAEARNLFEPIHKRRKILQQSFVLNSVKVNGTSKSVMVKVLLPMLSWIVYRMIPIRSILKVLTRLKTSLWEKYMDWIQQWQSKLNKQNGVAPLVRTGGSRHTGLAALPHHNIQCSLRRDFLSYPVTHISSL